MNINILQGAQTVGSAVAMLTTMLFRPPIASADLTAEDLLKHCEIAEAHKEAFEPGAHAPIDADTALYIGLCHGFLAGSAGTAATNLTICVDHDVSATQLRKVFIHWANTHPSQLQYSPSTGAVLAFIDAFPCRLKPQ